MIKETVNGTLVLKFDLLENRRGAACAVSTKISAAGELDLGVNGGLAPDIRRRNENIFCSALGADPSRLCRVRQVHGANVAVIAEPGLFSGDADGMMTNVAGIPLMVLSADCGVSCFYDEKHGAVAVMHSGWRGAFLNIYRSAAEAMYINYGTLPGDITACAGPMISRKNYEVGAEFLEKLEHLYPGKSAECVSVVGGRYYFSLRALLKIQLRALGIDRYEFMPLCTYDEKELFFSWRRAKDKGRFGLMAVLK